MLPVTERLGEPRLDVENCIRELVDFGVAQTVRGSAPSRYQALRPSNDVAAELLDLFLERRPRSHQAAARSANFAYRLRNESFSTPVGPLRCFERMTSARPCWSVSSL